MEKKELNIVVEALQRFWIEKFCDFCTNFAVWLCTDFEEHFKTTFASSQKLIWTLFFNPYKDSENKNEPR